MPLRFQIVPFDPRRDPPHLKAFIDENDRLRADQLSSLADPTGFFVLVALSEVTLGWIVVHTTFREDLGWIADEETLRFQSGDNAYLEHLHVRSDSRAMGCGTALLAAAEERAARALQKEKLWLHTSPGNATAKSFYARRGWSFQYTAFPQWRSLQPMEVWAKHL